MAPICKGVKADSTEEECKCDIYREEVREDLAAPGYCNFPTCRHHIGGHVRQIRYIETEKLPPSLPDISGNQSGCVDRITGIKRNAINISKDEYYLVSVNWNDITSIKSAIDIFINEQNLKLRSFDDLPLLAPEHVRGTSFDPLFNDDFTIEALSKIISMIYGRNSAQQLRRPIGAVFAKSGSGKSTALDYFVEICRLCRVDTFRTKMLNLTESSISTKILFSKFFKSNKQIFPVHITFNKFTSLIGASDGSESFEIAVRVLFYSSRIIPETSATFELFHDYISSINSNFIKLLPVHAMNYLKSEIVLNSIVTEIEVLLLVDEIANNKSYDSAISVLCSLLDNESFNCSSIISSLNFKNTKNSIRTKSNRLISWLNLPALDYKLLTIDGTNLVDIIEKTYCSYNFALNVHSLLLESLGGHGSTISVYLNFLERHNLHKSAEVIDYIKLRDKIWDDEDCKSFIISKHLDMLTLQNITPALVCQKILPDNVNDPELYLNSISSKDIHFVPRLSPFILSCYVKQNINSNESYLKYVCETILSIINFNDNIICSTSYEIILTQVLELRRCLLTHASLWRILRS